MEILDHLAQGFGVAFSLSNLWFALLGCLLGTLIGVLPGLGPLATVAMLLPMTFALPPTASIIMLAGIYYGAQYGGSTTAILVNIPGESSSVVTCLDGHQMARRGRAGAALATAALSSFAAGTIATLVIALAAIPLSKVGTSFESPEYFSLMVLGLIGAVVLASGSLLKSLAVVVFGLLLGVVGTDLYSGAQRMTLGIPDLADGIGFMPVVLGVFTLGDIMANLSSSQRSERSVVSERVTGLWLTKKEVKDATPAALRGTFLGSVLGLLPGGGAMLSSFASYIVEKRISKNPNQFGKGAIQGLAGPEAANNAGAQTSFIPMLTLGVPSNAVMALMVGALMIHGISPGPRLITDQPDLFWGLIASMWIGNAILLVINLPLVGVWVQLLRVPYKLLFPAILLFCAMGVYSVNNSAFEVVLAGIFGWVGFLFHKTGCEAAPLVLAVLLGPMMEDHLRRSMLVADGDLMIFFDRPISLGLLLAAVLIVVLLALPSLRTTRQEAFQE